MATMTPNEAKALRRAVLHLNAQAWGVAFGALTGLGLFVATMALVLKGGDNVGEHLGLLSVYLPGYRVTGLGAFIGLVYGVVLGYAAGRLIGMLYNRLARAPD